MKQLFVAVRSQLSCTDLRENFFVLYSALNLTGGDFNSQIGLQSWSYELPLERRRKAPDPYSLIPPAPPMGLSAFTGRKC